MQLGDVLDDATLSAADGAVEITRVDVDSRDVAPGSLFFALPGRATHGADHVDAAIARGARAVVTDRALRLDVPVVTLPTDALVGALARASAALAGHPERRAHLVGVTGTNGKTTVVTLIAALGAHLGWQSHSIGTLTGARTTPPAPELFRSLAAQLEDDDPAAESLVALEVSSHALDQGRVEGLRFDVAVFTNLSHDHLDYHKDMESYYRAKASLFTPHYADRAVVWVDDPAGARLADETTLPVTRVGAADASDVVTSLTGTSFFWRGHLVNTLLVGGYNVDNLLLALSAWSTVGADDGALARAAADLSGVPGRFEVFTHGGRTAVVDYAHTPDGLRRLLTDVRALAGGGRVVVVFGAGGDRDRAKRPEMGAVAAQFADWAVLTSDNPRSESADAIIDEIATGFAGRPFTRDVDRRAAIEAALEAAEPGDVVVVAGKGHETTQESGGVARPFDDRDVVREALARVSC